MKRRLLAVALLLVVSAAAALLGPAYLAERRAKDAVRGALNDPESARFTEVTWHESTSTTCGLINAKNSLGGYVGPRRFIAYTSGRVDLESPDTAGLSGDAFGSLWVQNC